MSKQTILTLGAIVLVILGFVWLGGGAKKETESPDPQVEVITNSQGNLTASESFYDFGSLSMAKGLARKQFTVENSGTEPVTVTRIETSCMCTVAYLSTPTEIKGPFGMPGHGGPVKTVEELINPGDKRMIEVVFDPAAHGPAGIGVIERVVRLNTKEGQTLDLRFKAQVTP